MADIHEKLLDKYGLDINQVNVLKLYKIENANIAPAELEEKIAATKKKWQQNVESGTNEKFVERDRQYLAQSEMFEEILRDQKVLRDLFAYYKKGEASTEASNFAREYFALIATTKKIKKADVEFFFEYFPEERKNKKAIVEMLTKEFKVLGLGKGKTESSDAEEKEEEGKKKREDSTLVVNLFEKPTILKLRKAIGYYEQAANHPAVRQKYPKISEGLYEFLELKEDEESKRFQSRVAQMKQQAYAYRQEFEGFTELVDFYNTLYDVVQYRDVVDNFTEFQLLLRYPKLTPYMYELEDMKRETLKQLFEIANREYRFRDLTDFILSYFAIIYDNFNIHDQNIKGVLKKAEKQAKKNRILNAIDEKTGRGKKRGVPLWVNVVHWLVYWPIFLFYLVFETAKVVVTIARNCAIPIFIGVFVWANWFFPKAFETENLLALGKLFSKPEWLAFVADSLHVQLTNNFELIVYSIVAIMKLLMTYILPTFFVAEFMYWMTTNLSDMYDWVGLERTFQHIFAELRSKTEKQFGDYRAKLFFKKNIGKVAVNVICVALLAGLVWAAPKAVGWLSQSTGWGQPEVSVDENSVPESNAEPEIIMVITASTANIRNGPSTNAEKVTTTNQGTTFIGTGKTETAANGDVWYEIYLNAEKTETAWASAKVIQTQD